ncbi:MAG: HD domain-containing protein, partial [Negativicutes bacterium]|nr:HD domain-containing protein [Negativicutes bacterium]
HYYEHFFREINTYWRMQFSIDDVSSIAEIFATIVDRTSRFTASHSWGVAAVAAFLAKTKGYCPEEVKMMRIAGLFHDLGKLAIPNHLLEKPGKLTGREFAIIKQHAYYSYRILEQIDGFTTIAEWAAYHHETLDGSGYPFRIGHDKLRLGSRILATADVFTALTEDRPYRPPITFRETQKIMNTMVSNRKLDGNIVGELFANYDELYNEIRGLPAKCMKEAEKERSSVS